MVNVIYGKRPLPLAYIVVKGKKGHFSEESHIALVEQVSEITANRDLSQVKMGTPVEPHLDP